MIKRRPQKRKHDENVLEIFAENMKSMMEIKNLTFKDLEGLSGVPSSSLNYYANGKVMIPLPAATAIAEAFGLTVDIMIKENMSVLKKDA
jgi:transcriptional regulator with XRE-family HTH domain